MSTDAEGPDPTIEEPAAEELRAVPTESRDLDKNEPEASASEPIDTPFVEQIPPPKPEATTRAVIRVASDPEPERARMRFRLWHAAVAAGLVAVLGAGMGVGMRFYAAAPPVQVALGVAGLPAADNTMMLLHHVEDEVRLLKLSLDVVRSNLDTGRQDDAIRSLKKSVDFLKQDLEGAKASAAVSVAQLGAKIDHLDRDPAAKFAETSARIDRDQTAKLADITARLDRIEKQVSSQNATGSIGPVARDVPLPVPAPTTVPAATAVTTEARAVPPKPAPLEGWMLRDVYGGVALLQDRSGDLREVAPGQFVPGVGEIHAIERRGRSWVVVTSRGNIEADNRW